YTFCCVCNKSEDYQHVRHCGNERVHFKFGCKKACDGCEERTQNHTRCQRKNHSSRNRYSCKVKNMSEHGTCIDTLMHNDGSCGHAHTNHTANGKIRTGQKDQSRNAEGKEHSRRSLLKDIQYVVVGKKRRSFHNRCNDTQRNEDQEDRNIQTILQQKVSAVKGILIVFPLLRSRLQECELRHTEHIDQMILIAVSVMSSVLDLLEIFVTLHFRIKQSVFLNVLFIFDLLMIRKFRHGFL